MYTTRSDFNVAKCDNFGDFSDFDDFGDFDDFSDFSRHEGFGSANSPSLVMMRHSIDQNLITTVGIFVSCR